MNSRAGMLWLSLIVFGWVLGASAADKNIECHASGNSVSVEGGGVVSGTAALSFTESKDAEGLRVLRNIEGSVSTADSLGDDEEPYRGSFHIASLTENPDYHPRRYVGYSQFQSFDATDTDGSREPGMWGQLILEKKTSRARFQAHYLFKAGEHMGGTLHMTCRVR